MLIDDALEHSKRAFSTSDNYLAQIFAFIGEYHDSFEEIEAEWVKDAKAKHEKEVRELEVKLSKLRSAEPCLDDYRAVSLRMAKKELEKMDAGIKEMQNATSEYKEGSASLIKLELNIKTKIADANYYAKIVDIKKE
jgi:Mg2+ and Co2+ transporter CorA